MTLANFRSNAYLEQVRTKVGDHLGQYTKAFYAKINQFCCPNNQRQHTKLSATKIHVTYFNKQ